MLVDTIQAELVRLQLHPVNLSISGRDDPLVTLQGSLLSCWSLPARVDGAWLLAQLRQLPDSAGPVAVMKWLVEAHADEAVAARPATGNSQLELFDSTETTPAMSKASAKQV